MKTLRLAKSYDAIVDDIVYEWLHWFKWFPQSVTDNYIYARRSVTRDTDGIHHIIYLHRMVCGLPHGYRVYFRNNNTLDCRKENLKCMSTDGKIVEWDMSCGASHFNGVVWDGRYGLWRSHLDGMIIGYYISEIEAATQYNKKAAKYAPDTINDLGFIE